MSRLTGAALGRAAALAALVVGLLPTPAGAQDRPTARLSLASQTTWVDGDGTFTVRLDVDAVRKPGRLDLQVTVHRAVRTRSQFVRTFDGELLGAVVTRRRVPFAAQRFDPGGAIAVPIDATDLRVGVYPVAVELVDTATDDAVATLVTHLLKVGDEPVEVPLDVAWVQPYGVDPALQPSGAIELGDDDLDHLRTIAARFDDGAPLTVVPTPETVEALASLDEGATVDALARLLADHQVLAAPFVDLDLRAVVGAGREEDVGRQRLHGDAVLDEVLGITADNRTWSLDGPVTRSALRAIHELGVRRVVIEETALEPLDSDITGNVTLARPFAVEGTRGAELDAASVDAGLLAHFEEEDAMLGAHRLLADLAVLHLDAPGTRRGVVVRPPSDWVATEAFLSTAIRGLAASPLVEPVTLDTLFDDVEPLRDEDDDVVVRSLARPGTVELGHDPAAIDRARAEMAGLSSLVVDLGGELDELDRALLVAESADLSADEHAAYVRSVRERVAAAAGRVQVRGSSARLTAREGTIPLTLVNDNDFPVQVDVEIEADKLEFTDGTVGRQVIRSLVLDADRTTTRAIPVKARTSGAFPLTVTLRSPDGQLQLGATRFTVTSTVASGVGLMLSIGAGLFLALWWGSHWRTVRRARRLVAAE